MIDQTPNHDKHSSADIKAQLAESFGGKAGDWIRTSKHKNDEGEIVREFHSRKTGEDVTVIEPAKGGALRFEPAKVPAANPLEEASSPPALRQPLSVAAIERDPAKNAAADKAIRILAGEARCGDGGGLASWGALKKLTEMAEMALANRYCFALEAMDDGESFMALITPIKHFEKEGACDDQSGPIGDLLPKCAEASEATWEIYAKEAKDSVSAARYLQSLGFKWHRGFQEFIDSGCSYDKPLAGELTPHVQAVDEAAKQVMEMILGEDPDETPLELLEQARPMLGGRFWFNIRESYEELSKWTAVITPDGLDTTESKRSYAVVKAVSPDLAYYDDCVEGLWFAKNHDSPAELATYLAECGYKWDEAEQKRVGFRLESGDKKTERSLLKTVKDALEK